MLSLCLDHITPPLLLQDAQLLFIFFDFRRRKKLTVHPRREYNISSKSSSKSKTRNHNYKLGR